ncbi:DUF3042 family protein [Levilactobacillus bambusae]|uniref:DUF3042 domain-containing protein n=1 Tax=Levilactobacillus bambusae TaxID=2024736 RepID=A0A2V1N178_9LACO|nr:DUF3042 family protein [Levilactobacillus bambusae]PWG00997.1 DUF3042 domain-containing protein [Levilactobacillus bambusae]
MNKFVKGFLFGTVATAGAVAGALFSFKKTVVEPIEEEEDRFDQNRIKAQRKAHSAHNG